ncbi:MAG TPA: acyltransferase [Thermoplasmata archaeon]|jgi:acetyltransferase-like isoleucine patch superfamily enzyme
MERELMNAHSSGRDEVMSYYNYKGRIGVVKLYFLMGMSWIAQSLAKFVPSSSVAVGLQRLRGVKIGEEVYVGQGVIFDEVYPREISIENNVSIGMRTMIFAHSNPSRSVELKSRFYPREVKPVVIRSGAWIAPGSIILAGVTLGANCVVSAGSVVAANVDPYTVVAGNPARPVRRLDSAQPKSNGP